MILHPTPIVVAGRDGRTSTSITPHVYVTVDVSALRHTEHVACSGFCGCPRDSALREIPPKPETPAQMRALVDGKGTCRSYAAEERVTLSHNPHAGESDPRPCTAKGCKFGHNRDTVAAEYVALLAEEAVLSGDTSKKGKAKFSRWRMKFAELHGNIQPGLYGMPLLYHHFDDQILDALHLALLNLPKLPWKYANPRSFTYCLYSSRFLSYSIPVYTRVTHMRYVTYFTHVSPARLTSISGTES